MPDPIFSDPRLAALYDTFDGGRGDLDLYVALADEFGAAHVVDIGCGTGCLAHRLAATGRRVTAVDPAAASLAIATAKPAAPPDLVSGRAGVSRDVVGGRAGVSRDVVGGRAAGARDVVGGRAAVSRDLVQDSTVAVAGAAAVTWIHGDATDLPPGLDADLATMTGNVAQVFLTDEDWAATLRAVRRALRSGGVLVFETRRPERRAWEEWAADPGPVVREVPGAGPVEQRREVTGVALPFVSFRYTYTFRDGRTVHSDSTLRFRNRPEIEQSLRAAGFAPQEVRDAPDRPGLEHVFISRTHGP